MYSTAKLTTVADCDLLLALVTKEKEDLEYKRTSEERQKKTFGSSSQEIDSELQSVTASIAATETIIAALPDGPAKIENQKKKVKLDYKKFVLDERRDSFGVVAMLQKEMEVSLLDLELAEISNFISEVTARKAAI